MQPAPQTSGIITQSLMPLQEEGTVLCWLSLPSIFVVLPAYLLLWDGHTGTE